MSGVNQGEVPHLVLVILGKVIEVTHLLVILFFILRANL
jgi:hypothetical protein